VIVFHALTRDNLRQIVRLQLERTEELLRPHGIQLEITAEAENYLVEHGYDPAFGARPLKRLIQKELVNKLATSILEGTIHSGTTGKSLCGRIRLILWKKKG
jgi:ATP-dependent Clp protease ATP-binding subunit ClpB